MNQVAMLRIGEEILTDPEGRGYTGKSIPEIVELLNSPYTKERIVIDEFPARIYAVLVGVADAPNFVTVEDVELLAKVQQYASINKI